MPPEGDSAPRSGSQGAWRHTGLLGGDPGAPRGAGAPAPGLGTLSTPRDPSLPPFSQDKLRINLSPVLSISTVFFLQKPGKNGKILELLFFFFFFPLKTPLEAGSIN